MKTLLGLILLWSINQCSGQGIEIVNNCTCKTFDGGIYSLMPLRRTDGKPRYIECCNLLLRVFVLQSICITDFVHVVPRPSYREVIA